MRPRAVRARVRLRKVSAHPRESIYVRVLVEIPGADLSAEESSADVIGALDVVAGKIERRLRKRKTDRLAKRVDGPRARRRQEVTVRPRTDRPCPVFSYPRQSVL